MLSIQEKNTFWDKVHAKKKDKKKQRIMHHSLEKVYIYTKKYEQKPLCLSLAIIHDKRADLKPFKCKKMPSQFTKNMTHVPCRLTKKILNLLAPEFITSANKCLSFSHRRLSRRLFLALCWLLCATPSLILLLEDDPWVAHLETFLRELQPLFPSAALVTLSDTASLALCGLIGCLFG